MPLMADDAGVQSKQCRQPRTEAKRRLELLSTRKATAFLNNVLKLTQSPSPEVNGRIRRTQGCRAKKITNLCGMLETVEP